VAFSRPLTALILAPTLHAGAADAGAIDLVRMLRRNGHRAIVASNGGRLEGDVTAAGAEFLGSTSPTSIRSSSRAARLR